MQKNAIIGHTNKNRIADNRKGNFKMAKILIIGGGVSGLSAGIYAQLTGHSATICEKHSILGGNLTGWQRGDYHIDNCIHWLTGTNPVTKTYKMWRELGALGDVEVYQGETLYTCEYKGKRLSLYRDLHRLRREMLTISPKDGKETRDLIAAVEYMQGICGIAGGEHDGGLTNRERVLGLSLIAKYYFLSVGELARRFSHPLIRSFIGSFWGDHFGSLALIFVMAHFCGENGGIPHGSSREMARRMEERFRSLGGKVLTEKEAVKLPIRGGRAESVIFADGTTLCADFIILTGEPSQIFGHLLDMPMPRRIERLYDSPRFKRFSSHHTAFAFDGEALPFSGDFIIPIPSRLRGLLRAEHLILREFSHEKSFAPEGKQLLQTMTFCDEAFCRELIALKERDKSAYRKRKQKIADAVGEVIIGQFPQMEGGLALIDVWTPATYRRFTGTEIGSYLSFTLPSRAIPLRLSNRIPGLSNVILASQWQQMPGGLPIAAEGGKHAIETIIAGLKSEKVTAERIPRGSVAEVRG